MPHFQPRRDQPPMHPDREKAEAAYQAALRTFNLAAAQAIPSVFEAAHEALRAARVAVVAMELRHPTAAETRRNTATLRRRNRGLE